MQQDICKSLINKSSDEAKTIIKLNKLRGREFPWKEPMMLPHEIAKGTLVYLTNKGKVVDAFFT